MSDYDEGDYDKRDDDYDDGDDFDHDDDDDFDADEEYGGKKKTNKRKKMQGSRATKKPEKKKKAFDLNRFVEGEAEEDEELSEEDVRMNREDRIRELDIYKQPTRKRMPTFLNATNEEEVNEILQRDMMGEDIGEEELDHQKLLPTKDDPKLFRVRVREGFEREVTLNLMHKFLFLQGKPDEIVIYSASSLDRYKGFIFIEADDKSHVIHALKGFNYINVESITLIEIGEMTEIFKPDPLRDVKLEDKQWVRIRSGPYQGDLGKVDNFNENKTKVTVMLIPRLSSNMEEEEEEDDGRDFKDRRSDNLKRYREQMKRKQRPPPRFFDYREHSDVVQKRDSQNNILHVYRNQYFRGGFILKTFQTRNLITTDVSPTLEEAQLFAQGEMKNLEEASEEKSRHLEEAMATIQQLKAETNKFTRGDKVRVIQGDLKNLIGTVTSSSENKVVVLPEEEDLQQEMTFYPDQLQKYFSPGDKVVATIGKNAGKAGTVIKVEDNVATLVAEDMKGEFACLVNDLVYAERNVVIPSDQFKSFKKYDMIRLHDKETFGVIIGIENISVRIVDQDGNIRSFRNVEIEGKIDTRRNVARNSHNQNISVNCRLRVLDGQFKGKVGQVKHVYKDRAFLYNQEFLSAAGIFVEHINNCYLVNATATQNSTIQDKATQALREKEKQLKGKKCVITLGSFKGHQGIVKSISDKFAQVELSTMPRTIPVPVNGVELQSNIENRRTTGYGMEGKTPAVGRQTQYMESPAFSMVSPGYNQDYQNMSSPGYYSRIK